MSLMLLIVMACSAFLIGAIGASLALGKRINEPKPDGAMYGQDVLAAADRSSEKAGKLMIALSVVVLVGCAVGYAVLYADAASHCRDTTMAYVMSQKAAADLLQSPASAKFPGMTDVRSVSEGGCKFHVTAYVDVQNELGATKRTPYTAEMEYIKDSERWRATNVMLAN